VLDYWYFGVYKFFSFILWVLPHWMILLLMKTLSWFFYTVSSKHRKIIDVNLNLAFYPHLNAKEKKEIGIHSFMNLLDTVFGIIKRGRISRDKVLENVIFEGEEIVYKYKSEGKKIIFISGHQGNWELLLQAIALKFDIKLAGVARKIDSNLMHKVLKENREQFDVEIIDKKGAMKGCIKALSQNKAVGILVDQSIDKSQSIDVTLFGQKSTHSPLASILSRRFNAALIPIFIDTSNYIDYHVKIYEPLKCIKTDNQESDLKFLTQQQADIMEEVITKHPRQWLWMHKRWKEYYSYKYNVSL